MNESSKQPERLQKAMARLGLASRRRAEELISKGLVKVNGVVITQPGTKVAADDLIEVEGAIISSAGPQELLYILLNKPEGVISSVTDPRGRKTVVDLLGENIAERVYPVGRLDYDTSGLLLLTNDGDLTYRLTHPSYGVEKTYRAVVRSEPSSQALKTLQAGVLLEDGLTSPAKINRVEPSNKGNSLFVVEISIHEGKNRQVRRMFEKVGYPVCSLQRIAFGPLRLDKPLTAGNYRFLNEIEVKSLKQQVGL